MSKDGYLERDEDGISGARWRTTIKGNALAQASAAAAVSRKTADRAVGALLERVRQVNTDEKLAYIVEQVILFGSYLGDAPKVNDVDVAVQLRRRSDDDAQFLRQCSKRVQQALRDGRVFRSSVEQVLWPQLEIARMLKSGSRVLSLHDAELEALLLEQPSTRVIYPEPEDQ
jgi:predicted nucleotidyltransferase